MKSTSISLSGLLLVLLVFARPISAQSDDEVTKLPKVEVEATRLERYATRVMLGTGDSFRIILRPVQAGRGAPVFLAGDLRVNDEIVRINGRDLSSFRVNNWSNEFVKPVKITVRRRVAVGKYDLIEVECVSK